MALGSWADPARLSLVRCGYIPSIDGTRHFFKCICVTPIAHICSNLAHLTDLLLSCSSSSRGCKQNQPDSCCIPIAIDNKRLNCNRTPSFPVIVLIVDPASPPHGPFWRGGWSLFVGGSMWFPQHDPRRHFEVDLPGHGERRVHRGTVARLWTYLCGLRHVPWRRRCFWCGSTTRMAPKPGPKLDLPRRVEPLKYRHLLMKHGAICWMQE